MDQIVDAILPEQDQQPDESDGAVDRSDAAVHLLDLVPGIIILADVLEGHKAFAVQNSETTITGATNKSGQKRKRAATQQDSGNSSKEDSENDENDDGADNGATNGSTSTDSSSSVVVHMLERIIASHQSWPNDAVLPLMSLLVDVGPFVTDRQWLVVQQRLLHLNATSLTLRTELPGMMRCCLKLLETHGVTGSHGGNGGGRGRKKKIQQVMLGDGWVDVMRSMLKQAPKESFANACLVLRMGLRKTIGVSRNIIQRYEVLVQTEKMGGSTKTASKHREQQKKKAATTTVTTVTFSPTWHDFILLLIVVSCHHDVVGSGTALFASLVHTMERSHDTTNKVLSETTKKGAKIVSVGQRCWKIMSWCVLDDRLRHLNRLQTREQSGGRNDNIGDQDENVGGSGNSGATQQSTGILETTVIMGKKYASVEFVSVLVPALCDGCALWCMLDEKIMPTLPSKEKEEKEGSVTTGGASGSTAPRVSLRDLQELASTCLTCIFEHVSEARADVLELAFQKRGTVMRYGEAKHSGIQATNLDVVYAELLHHIGSKHAMLLIPMVATVQSFLSALFDHLVTSTTAAAAASSSSKGKDDPHQNKLKQCRKMFLAFGSLLTVSTSFCDFIFLYLRKLMSSSVPSIRKFALTILCDVFGWSSSLRKEVQIELSTFLQSALRAPLETRQSLYKTLEIKLEYGGKVGGKK